jgi:hypothetical protein
MRIIGRGEAPLNKVDNGRLRKFGESFRRSLSRLMVLYSPNENRAGLYEGLMIRPFVEFIGDPPVWNPVQKSLDSKYNP